MLLPVLFVAGFLLARGIRARWSQDTVSRQRREARGRVRQRLRLASSFLKAGNRVSFFGEIASVIHEQLAAKLGIKVQGLTTVELKQLLDECGMEGGLQKQLIDDLEVCDFARFAPAAAEDQQMADTLQRTRRLLDAIDRARLKEPPRSVESEAAQ